MRSSVNLRNITKRFPGGVLANREVSCEALGGEIHAILGENGAGKTTLMRVLAGFYRPDEGSIEINGLPVHFSNPKEAKQHGIGMVHQHFSLVEAFTVAENLALSATNTPALLKSKSWTKHLAESAEQLGLQIRPDAYVWRLSIGERQRVEIFRLILEGAKILILDEPTSILAPQEADHLFAHLKRFARMGHVILLVTHKIQHVKAVTDRVTILRDGAVVSTGKAADLTEVEIAELMMGRVIQKWRPDHSPPQAAEPKTILEVRDLTVKPLSSYHGLKNVSFELRAGEILGVAGISGNGQDELVAAITGMSTYKGVVRREDSPGAAHSGLGYIPADRIGVGVAPTLPVQDNLSLRDYASAPFSVGTFLRTSKLRDAARRRIADYKIRVSDPGVETSVLSGGNIQKVVLARELSHNPGLIIAVTPTAGLDIGTTDFVHREIVRHAGGGAGVLLISEDLDELVALSDRVLVLYAGRLVGVVENVAEDVTDIGLLMTGLQGSSTRRAAAV